MPNKASGERKTRLGQDPLRNIELGLPTWLKIAGLTFEVWLTDGAQPVSSSVMGRTLVTTIKGFVSLSVCPTILPL